MTTAQPHISDVRTIMMAQLQALRNATGSSIETELKRSKAVSDLSQTMINSAKVEIDYLVATEQNHSPFLESPPDVHTGNRPNPKQAGIVRNSADTAKPKITRTNWLGLKED